MEAEDARRALPSVDEALHQAAVRETTSRLPRPLAVRVVREAIDAVRERLEDGGAGEPVEGLVQAEVRRRAEELAARRLQPVINATGVVIHTNLGRAPLPQAAVRAIAEVAQGYSNLEWDILSGRRGRRDTRIEPLLQALTGAEAGLVVNNNAAAVLLVLAAVARGREVIVSRGELVEIGDSFRIPEIIAHSGCVLKEVGTTNRTRPDDYEKAIGPQTGAILKAHPSNYRIVGFTESVEARTLAEMAHRRGLLLLVDLGSGAMVPSEAWGAGSHEPTAREMVEAGADAVMFSGDKLLGGPQAGIVAGRRDVVQMARRHPLFRAVRVGKLTLAALAAVLDLYLEGRVTDVPVWEMLHRAQDQLLERAHRLAEAIRQRLAGELEQAVTVRAVAMEAEVGGGSLPGAALPSAGVEIAAAGDEGLAECLARALRLGRPPVVGRIERERLVLDLRTVWPEQDEAVAEAAARAVRACRS
ncbi:L-seryl-tRNA(Sec) selenium transferase [Carboxydochorda subterranea]|uniref:L-seryl-tRNA(Sec) selenium transferase n=1 Tax=Carboxydichorda subterranea TaxID=3109565 RepID=A0ABZ1BZN9_9FIRM|nr:L-seryl-tRNA(Sec) selenium transferase [Limnochorda sp. L945t]WRP17971.1 L-seryl-tRNA(Sec) selenium transferase [Limnochorda sp. L945t]